MRHPPGPGLPLANAPDANESALGMGAGYNHEARMKIEGEPRAGAMVLRVAEARIDAAVAIRFKDDVRRAAGAGPGPVVLDLGAVSFIDSSGLGALVATMKLLGPERPLVLCAPTEPVAKVLRLTRMDSVFDIHIDAEAALAGLAGAA